MNLPNIKEAKKRTNSKVETLYNEYDYNINKVDNLKYTILTYGCAMNVHDSEEMAALLESMNFVKHYDYYTADLVILNTCAIR